jgi:hypothetical protein
VTNHIRLNAIIPKQLAHDLGLRVPEAERLEPLFGSIENEEKSTSKQLFPIWRIP